MRVDAVSFSQAKLASHLAKMADVPGSSVCGSEAERVFLVTWAEFKILNNLSSLTLMEIKIYTSVGFITEAKYRVQ